MSTAQVYAVNWEEFSWHDVTRVYATNPEREDSTRSVRIVNFEHEAAWDEKVYFINADREPSWHNVERVFVTNPEKLKLVLMHPHQRYMSRLKCPLCGAPYVPDPIMESNLLTCSRCGNVSPSFQWEQGRL